MSRNNSDNESSDWGIFVIWFLVGAISFYSDKNILPGIESTGLRCLLAPIAGALFILVMMFLYVVMNAVVPALLEWVTKWFTILGTGIFLLLWLNDKGSYVWMAGTGVAYLVIGIFCLIQSRRKESGSWAVNGLAAVALSLIMVVVAVRANPPEIQALVKAMRAPQKPTAQNDPKLFAEGFLATLSTASPENQKAWGLSDFSIFGRERFLEMDLAAGDIKVKRVTRSPATFDVMIPLWVRGKSLKDGTPVKLSRKLFIRVTRNQKGDMVLDRYEFREDQPLTFSQQFNAWFTLTIGMLIFAVFLMFLSDQGDFLRTLAASCQIAWVRYIAILLGLAWVSYASYICFGSVGAIIIGDIACYILTHLVLSVQKAWRQANKPIQSRI